jgi:hypothetical protein
MERLTEAQFESLAAPGLRQIFQALTPYHQPFHPAITHRRIIYEYWYAMDSDIYNVIRHTSSLIGENGFYVSILDRPPTAMTDRPYHWYFTFAEYEIYQRWIEPLPNVTYSGRGSWGLLGSDEHFGVLGGITSIMDYVEATYDQQKEQQQAFVAAWTWNNHHLGSDITWLPSFLSHINCCD